MPGQRDFLGGCKVTGTETAVVHAPDEGGFRKVHLPGNRQHRITVKIGAIKDNRARISTERLGGKGINLVKRIRRHGSIQKVTVTGSGSHFSITYGWAFLPRRAPLPSAPRKASGEHGRCVRSRAGSAPSYARESAREAIRLLQARSYVRQESRHIFHPRQS